MLYHSVYLLFCSKVSISAFNCNWFCTFCRRRFFNVASCCWGVFVVLICDSLACRSSSLLSSCFDIFDSLLCQWYKRSCSNLIWHCCTCIRNFLCWKHCLERFNLFSHCLLGSLALFFLSYILFLFVHHQNFRYWYFFWSLFSPFFQSSLALRSSFYWSHFFF